MDYLLNLVASGLIFGALYGMVAISFAVIYKTTGVVNFAQGEVMMFVTYVAWWIGTTINGPLWALMAIAIVVGAVLGALLERVFIRPMLGQSQFAIIMTTVGMAIVLRGLVPVIWGVESAPIETPLKSQVIEFGSVLMLGDQLMALACFLTLSLLVWLFFRFSRVGAAMRATAHDETAALLMGIDVRRLHSLSWMISASVAGVTGVCYGVVVSRAPDMWFLGLQAFPATILGGLDSPLGSSLGGLIIGVTSTLSEGYIGRGLKEISGFAIIIAILMIRPYGLFGEKELERV